MAIKFTGELAPKGSIPDNRMMHSKYIDFASNPAGAEQGLKSLTQETSSSPGVADFFVVVDASGNQKRVKMDAINAANFSTSSLDGDIQSVEFTGDSGTTSGNNNGALSFSILGGDNLKTTASSSSVTIDIDMSELENVTATPAQDYIILQDNTSTSFKKTSFDNFVGGIDGSGLTNTSGVLSIDLATSSGLQLDAQKLKLADVGTAGTYGSATMVPQITTDDKGRITAVTESSITQSLTISDGSSSDAIQLTETFTIAGGAGITSAVTNNMVTLNLDDSISVDTITVGDNGTTGAHALWNTVTGAITIGATNSTVTFPGSVTASQGFTSINSSDLEVEDNNITLCTNVGSTDFGGSGSTVDGAIVFAGLDANNKVVTDSNKLVCKTKGFNDNGTTKGILLSTYIDDTTYGNVHDNDVGTLSMFGGAGFRFDGTTGDAIQNGTTDDGTVVWDGSDLWIFDA